MKETKDMQDQDNPMDHPEEQPTATTSGDDSPKFGRLLLVLAGAVLVIIAITFASEALYS